MCPGGRDQDWGCEEDGLASRPYRLGVLDAGFGEAFGHFGFHELGGDFVEGAGHDGVDVVGGEADAVVGDAGLGEVVGADFLGAVAGADEGAAVF